MQEKISPMLDSMCCELIGQMLEQWATTNDVEVTLAVASSSEETEVFVFTHDEPDQCLEAARGAVRAMAAGTVSADVPYAHMRPYRYALGYRGVVSVDQMGEPTEYDSGQLCDALIVEFGEAGMNHAWSCITLVNADGTDFMCSDPYPGGEVERLL